jgi:hypothetical protein
MVSALFTQAAGLLEKCNVLVTSMSALANEAGQSGTSRLLWVALIVFTVGITVYSAVRAETETVWLSIMLVLVTGIVSCVVWLAFWRESLPIMPLFAVMHILNYGLQFLSTDSDVFFYSDEDRFVAALTVAGFLAAATTAWILVMSLRVRFGAADAAMDAGRINRALPWGFAIAVIFNWLVMTGDAYQLQNFLSVARAIGGTILNVCAFLLGALWSSRVLRPGTRVASVALFGFGLILTLPSVHLYTSLFVVAVFLVGYVFGTRRIPLASIAAILLVYSVLQAGKPAMREQYWDQGVLVSSVWALPGFLADWVKEGIVGFAAPSEKRSVQLGERIGLMHMLLRVQNMSPQLVEFLYGETYLLIPRLLVPRFLDPEKPITNAGLVMLNIRYGVLTDEDTQSTSVGWGLISEAYANFGTAGVLGVGVIIGLLVALVGVWASGAPPLSARTVIAIVFMSVLFNLEGDAALLSTAMFQGIVAALLLAFVLGAFRKRKARTRLANDAAW